MAKEDRRSDAIDALLHADEQELRAKRARLRFLAQAIESARESITAAQEAAGEVREENGVSRADLARTFDLSDAERALFVPARRRSGLAQHEDGTASDNHSSSSGPAAESNAEPEESHHEANHEADQGHGNSDENGERRDKQAQQDGHEG